MRRRPQRESLCHRIRDPATPKQPGTDETAENTDTKDDDRGDRNDAAERFRNRYGDRHRHGFRSKRSLQNPIRPQHTRQINHTKNSDHAADDDRHENRKQPSPHMLELFVHQITQSHDRKSQSEIEQLGRTTVMLVTDTEKFQIKDHRHETEQHGVQQGELGSTV